jgi:hypothetical protein
MANIEIKKLNSRHRRMIEAITVEGSTGREVCERFGISAPRLSVLRQTKLWKDEETSLNEKVRNESIQKLQSLAPKAIQALEETVELRLNVDGETTVFNDPKVRIQAAKEILNRSGIKEMDESAGNSMIIQMYVPGWGTGSGKNEVVDVEFEHAGKIKNY